MILIINTSGVYQTVGLYDLKSKKVIARESWKVQNDNRKDIVFEIKQLFDKAKKSIKAIKCVAVYAGPGSYTSVRVGVSIANAIGWSENIPVIGAIAKEYNQKMNVEDIVFSASKKIENLKKYEFTKPVVVYYENSLK